MENSRSGVGKRRTEEIINPTLVCADGIVIPMLEKIRIRLKEMEE